MKWGVCVPRSYSFGIQEVCVHVCVPWSKKKRCQHINHIVSVATLKSVLVASVYILELQILLLSWLYRMFGYAWGIHINLCPLSVPRLQNTGERQRCWHAFLPCEVVVMCLEEKISNKTLQSATADMKHNIIICDSRSVNHKM
jgi:hypothetical protein